MKEMREPNQQALAAVMPQVAERINTVKDQGYASIVQATRPWSTVGGSQQEVV